MTQDRKLEISRKLILEALREYRALFNKGPEDRALELYAKMLADQFEFKQVTWALSEFVKEGSAFFPSCGELFRLLKPSIPSSQDKAPQVAAEIIQALRWYGPHDEARMMENVSPEARQTLLALGNTADIRNSENIDTVRAQLERLARGVLSSRQVKEKNLELQRIGIDLKGALDRTNMRLIEFNFPQEVN